VAIVQRREVVPVFDLPPQAPPAGPRGPAGTPAAPSRARAGDARLPATAAPEGSLRTAAALRAATTAAPRSRPSSPEPTFVVQAYA